MTVWGQLNPSKAHVAYALVSAFGAFYSVCSSVVKERLYLGEAVPAAVFGVIIGPHCLGWFEPTSWPRNSPALTLELSRILLCLDIFAVGVQLPPKYMKRHFWAVISLMVPVMIMGWLIIALFIWAIFPRLKFTGGLLISATITATDPVLAQAVVGSGKFGKKVPAHLRNLITAESACNDGMAVPFVYLALNVLLHSGHPSEVAKGFFCNAVLYECVFGCIVGTCIGYVGRKLMKNAAQRGYVDRPCILGFYLILAVLCSGCCSTLGADDLLASFAAGCAFAWDGWAASATGEDTSAGSDAAAVIDLLLNISYFIYLGAIIPWQEFNHTSMGLSPGRLVGLAFVVIFLRRIPEALAILPICSDINSWQEAVFVGHFGPIGVGAVFASWLAISELEAASLSLEGPFGHGPFPNPPSPNVSAESAQFYYLMRDTWPIVCFLIVTSVIVHGSSPAVMGLARHVRSVSIRPPNEVQDKEGGADATELGRVSSHINEDSSRIAHLMETYAITDQDLHPIVDTDGIMRYPASAYEDGRILTIVDQYGETLHKIPCKKQADKRTGQQLFRWGSKKKSKTKADNSNQLMVPTTSLRPVRTWASSFVDKFATQIHQSVDPSSNLEQELNAEVNRAPSSINNSLNSLAASSVDSYQPRPLNNSDIHALEDGENGIVITDSDGYTLGTIQKNEDSDSAYAKAKELIQAQQKVADLSQEIQSNLHRPTIKPNDDKAL